jgi:hypothetical protein
MKNLALEIAGRVAYFGLGFVTCLYLFTKGIL